MDINTIKYPHAFNPEKENVIIYCHSNHYEQTEFGHSLNIQKETLTCYCQQHNYNVVMEVIECCSGIRHDLKQCLLAQAIEYCKLHINQPLKLLVLRWDRISRNFEFAIKLINYIHDELKLEVNAIENPVDFNSPNWRTLIGVYCGHAMSTHNLISQRTKDGIHGSKEKGLCTNKAPYGYINKHRTDERGRVVERYVDVNMNEAIPLKAAFEALAKGNFTISMARSIFCPKVPMTTFRNILRNPFYMGKIRVSAYKSTPEHMVDGIHEALVSEEVFYAVQNNLGKTSNKHEKD